MIGKTRYPIQRSTHRLKMIALVLSLIIIVLGVTGLATILHHHIHSTSSIPNPIVKQLSFSPFIVSQPNTSGAVASSYKYDANSSVLSYIVKTKDSRSYTVSEQATPANFSEIPSLYTKLLGGLNKFDSLETSNGTVNLTRPDNSPETAVINGHGVLVFVRADSGNTSKAAWKQLIDGLNIQR